MLTRADGYGEPLLLEESCGRCVVGVSEAFEGAMKGMNFDTRCVAERFVYGRVGFVVMPTMAFERFSLLKLESAFEIAAGILVFDS